MSNPDAIKEAALAPGPEMNKTLRRMYGIVQSIGAWARSGMRSPLWATDQEAGRAVLSYVGPGIDPLIATSLHYTAADMEFLGKPEVVNAIFAVIKEIYSGKNRLVNGLFPEEESPSAQP